MNLATTVGIELEVNNVANPTSDRDFVTRNVEKLVPGWLVKNDGSCGKKGGYGVEVISPILKTEADLSQVAKICPALKRLSFRVDGHCGLHVHLGVKDLTYAQTLRLLRFFVTHEDAFFSLDPSRRLINFCKALPRELKTRLLSTFPPSSQHDLYSAWPERYFWLNGCSYAKHGTLELRLMGGTLNERHVLGWVRFLLYLVESVKNYAELDKTQKSAGDAFTDMVVASRIARHLDTPGTKLAYEWLMKRHADCVSFQDLDKQRAERRARRLAAWAGGPKFEPVEIPVSAVDTIEIAD